jgi:cation:H+ antiporter
MITFLMFGAGVGLLVFGADRLVAGASGLARRLKIPSVVIGLTIVALGTSRPSSLLVVLVQRRARQISP